MKRVGLLRGGRENYDMSVFHGGNLISFLHENFKEKYKPVDVLVDKDGVWYIAGVPASAGDLLHRVDFVWNVAHTNFSKTLLEFSIPEIGMPENFSYQSPEIWKKEAEGLGLNIPRRVVLPLYQKDFDGPRNRYATKKAKEVHEKFSPPWLVKSLTPSHMGVHVANTFNELVDAIEDGVSHGETIVVEELIPGQKEEAHTVSGYRGEPVYAFPSDVSVIAKRLHEHLGARHYLQSEYLVSPRRGVYLIEMSFVPDLRANSNFHTLCAKVGATGKSVIEHILEHEA